MSRLGPNRVQMLASLSANLWGNVADRSAAGNCPGRRCSKRSLGRGWREWLVAVVSRPREALSVCLTGLRLNLHARSYAHKSNVAETIACSGWMSARMVIAGLSNAILTPTMLGLCCNAGHRVGMVDSHGRVESN